MKTGGKIIIGAVTLAAAAAGIIALVMLNNTGYRSIKVSDLNGTTSVTSEGAVSDAFKGQNLKSGDRADVKEASDLTLELDSDKHVYAAELTRFSLEATGTSGKDSRTLIRLEKGCVLNSIDKKLSGEESYVVKAPNASMSVRGTVFKVTYYEETNTTVVEVQEGIVHVESADGSVNEDIGAGGSRVIRDNEPEETEAAASEPAETATTTTSASTTTTTTTTTTTEAAATTEAVTTAPETAETEETSAEETTAPETAAETSAPTETAVTTAQTTVTSATASTTSTAKTTTAAATTAAKTTTEKTAKTTTAPPETTPETTVTTEPEIIEPTREYTTGEIEEMLTNYLFKGGELDKAALAKVTIMHIFSENAVFVSQGMEKSEGWHRKVEQYGEGLEREIVPMDEVTWFIIGEEKEAEHYERESFAPRIDLSFLKYMPELEIALICSKDLSDLSAVKDCPNIHTFSVYGSNIDIESLKALKDMKSLTVMGEGITKNVLTELQTALPDCRIPDYITCTTPRDSYRLFQILE